MLSDSNPSCGAEGSDAKELPAGVHSEDNECVRVKRIVPPKSPGLLWAFLLATAILEIINRGDAMSIFGQTNEVYLNDLNELNTVSTGEAAFMGMALGTILLFSFIFWVVSVIALWKVFEKAGEKGWKALIPVYNYWVLCEIAGRPGWWALSVFASIIPYVGWIVAFVVYIVVALDIGKAFKKSTLFSVLGLIIFSFIGLLILGFGQDKYHKPATHKSHTSGPAPKAA